MRTTAGVAALAVFVALAGRSWAGEVCGASFATNCAKCHGEDGKGGTVCKKDASGALAGKSGAEAVETVKAVKMHSSLKNVSDDDIKAAVAFMTCGVKDDKSVYLENCAKCHGNNAKGGNVCKKDVTATIGDMKDEDALKAIEAGKMHGPIKKLSQEDLLAAVAYFRAGATFGKKCANCHGDDAKGGKVCKKDITAVVSGKSCGDACKAIKEGKAHGTVKDLSDDELKALVEYLKGLAKAK